MLGWLIWTGVVAGALLLCSSGLGHVLRRRQLDAVLLTHRLRAVIRRLVVATLGPAEIVIGVGVLASLLSPGNPFLPVLLMAGLYSGFAVYLVLLVRVAPGVSCGCFGDDEPAGPATVVRAAVLATACWAAVLWQPALPVSLQSKAALLGLGALVALMANILPSVLGLRSHAEPPVR